VQNSKDIKFNLSGMQDVGELLRNLKYGVASGSTNWELQVVKFAPELRAKVALHLGEKIYTTTKY